MSNETQAIFDQMNLDDAFQEATANQGHGSLGEWPENGDHDCFITSVTVSASDFRQSEGQPDVPGFQVQFHYQLVDDPKVEMGQRTEPLKWDGAPMSLPMKASDVTSEKSKIRTRIELERLKGHLKTVLGKEPTSIQGGINQVQNLLTESDKAVIAKVRVKNREGDRWAKEHLLSRSY